MKKEQKPSRLDMFLFTRLMDHSTGPINSSYGCLKMNRKGTVPFTERNKLEEHGVPLTFRNTKSVHLLNGTVPFTDRNKLEEHSVPLRFWNAKTVDLLKRNHLLA